MKKITRFTIVFEYDPEDRYWSVSSPDFPGLISGGDTLAEALRRGPEGVALILVVGMERGEIEVPLAGDLDIGEPPEE